MTKHGNDTITDTRITRTPCNERSHYNPSQGEGRIENEQHRQTS